MPIICESNTYNVLSITSEEDLEVDSPEEAVEYLYTINLKILKVNLIFLNTLAKLSIYEQKEF